jgi:hypothetical protein
VGDLLQVEVTLAGRHDLRARAVRAKAQAPAT